MDGLGHGYDAFVERIQSDFASSSATTKGSRQNADNASQPLYPSEYMSYPSSSNAFTVNRGPSPSLSSSSMHSGFDVKQENAMPRLPGQGQGMSTDVNLMPDMPPRHRGHRRAQSEIAYHVPDDLSPEHEPSLLETPTISDEASDDLFSMYIDMDKINSHTATSGSKSLSETYGQLAPQPHHMRSASVDEVLAKGLINSSGGGPATMHVHHQKPRHQHSNSIDGSMPIKEEFITSELHEAKKAMPANKLAELALVDPKRAKRILANRQSAARSKERKVQYISELERRVQTLQIEATTLSAQLTILQRDTSGLTSENNELRLRLQSMEQQAQLRDALSDALREEVQRLKLMARNGETMPHGPGLPHNQQFHHLQQPQQSQLQQLHYGFTN